MSSLFTSIPEVYYVDTPRFKKTFEEEYMRDIFYYILLISQHKAKRYKKYICSHDRFFVLYYNIISHPAGISPYFKPLSN